jgi:hypothetical protein
VAEPRPALERASQAARNASSEIRRRLRVFLSSDAVRKLRAGGLAWVVAAVGAAAGVLVALSDFTHLAYVRTLTASCSDLATAQDRGSCLTVGHESHHYAFALLGLFMVVMAYGVAAGASRPAAVALVAAGAVVLGITLLHDLPNTTKTGEVGIEFARAKAHKGAGFWFELVGAALAIAAGLLALWRNPPPLRDPDRSRPAAAEAEEPSAA